jgi:uncharacterized protein YegJ (DUF2314 family)
MRTRSLHLLTLSVVTLAACQSVQSGSGTPSAPTGVGSSAIAIADAKAREEMDAELAAYIARAKATFPDVKRRYEAGLPRGHALFITTRVRDDFGNTKDAFVAVEFIREGRILGRIASETGFLTGVRKGQRYNLTEEELIDWMITGPSGASEGNFVGQFIESKRKTRP